MKRVYKRASFKWILRIIMAGIIITGIYGIAWYRNRPVCEKCNVIFVSLDTLSGLHLPCYGYDRNTSPNLCAFGKKNIFFSNAYSQAPMTLPSHFSMFTSLYPNQHKIMDEPKKPLDENKLMLAQVFRTYGYKTIYNGPLTDDHFPLDRGTERGFDVIEKRDEYQISDINYWDKSITRFIDNVHNKKSTFMFLHTYAVHDPYLTGHTNHPFTHLPEYPNIDVTADEFHKLSMEYFKFCTLTTLNDKILRSRLLEKDILSFNKLQKLTDFGESFNIYSNLPNAIQVACLSAWHSAKIDFSDKNQREYLRAMYDEQILNLDKKLNKLYRLMSDPQVAKNTILVIVGDHGEEFWEHGTWGHSQNLYLSSIQVPLIMHIPGISSKLVDNLVQGIDIYPTVLSLTGLKPLSKIQGIDLTGLIKGKKNAVNNSYVLSEWMGKSAIQMEGWRFYYDSKKQPLELYDLKKDRGEQVNVVNKHPAIVKEFMKLMPY